MPEWQPGEIVSITHRVEVTSAVTLTEWAEVEALFPLHIYTEKTIRDRFDWEERAWPPEASMWPM